VEAARRLGKAVPGAAELAGIQNRGDGGAALRGGRVRRQRGKKWVQGKLRRLGGAPIGRKGSRWEEKTGAARALRRLEVEGGWVDLFVIMKSLGA
jgi:hypothetical protein